jgi:type IV secretion system protein VirD4
MKFDECLDNELFSSSGIPLGFVTSDRDNRHYGLYYSDERHLITVAPNGTGKGTCAQKPVLLLYDAPMIVIDPKGENAAVTAKYRKEGMSHNVFILNPFNVLDEHFASEGFNSKETDQFESACFNPLAALNPEDDNFVSDVASLSEALIESDVNVKDPFWPDSARELVTCLILYICTAEDYKNERNLIQMRRLLTQNTTAFLKTMEIIARSEFAPMAQKARRLIDDNRTNEGIILNAISQTSFLDDPILAKNLVSNDIDFLKLKEGKMTVYVILPAKQLSTYSKWFKLVVTSALNALMSTHKQGNKKVLVMLDECSILGRLSCIETAVGLARGYGIQLWSFWQDIHQLNDVYKERAESFLANAGVQQYFTPNDMVMAEKLSKRLGNTTIFTRNISSDFYKYQSISFSETAIPFRTPVELFGLQNDKQLLFFAGKERAVLGIKHPYHDDADCKDKASNNPYFKE